MLGCSMNVLDRTTKIEEMESCVKDLQKDISIMRQNGYPEEYYIDALEEIVFQLKTNLDCIKLLNNDMTDQEFNECYQTFIYTYNTIKDIFKEYL